ncbi:metallo-beta-lactamase domain-containing protein 1 isoform X2 [Athalia rosae]|uniref:metallo-beta-lactamase domain-containing protein 1 isoform X2 n=1 Tax=Athalia rosae TaxID=37344 RepID=UPI0020347C76|nr:metallo-beta-lactamase domain-containing protein 1 isoform X2 [Athalia rosae]
MCEIFVLFDGYSRQINNKIMEANCTCTLIKAQKNIIVDTMTAWDRSRLEDALLRHGILPSNIHYVVCTHSHADHIGNNNLFTNAEHIVGYSVQQKTSFYDKQIEQGVRVTATPGHTHEDVTVLVENDSVKYALTGDLFEKEEDITNPALWQNLGTLQLRKVQALTRLRILKYADWIIPGHGAMFKKTSVQVAFLEKQILETT